MSDDSLDRTTNTVNHIDPWSPCQPGLLSRVIGRRLYGRQLRRTLSIQMLIIYFIGLLTVYATFNEILAPPANQAAIPAEYGCSDVRNWLMVYANNQLNDRVIKNCVAYHLANCSSCDREYQRLIGADLDLVKKHRQPLMETDGNICNGQSPCRSPNCPIHSCGADESPIQVATAALELPTDLQESSIVSNASEMSAAACKKIEKNDNGETRPSLRPEP